MSSSWTHRKWAVLTPVSEKIKQKFPELHPIVLQLLYNRELTSPEQIDEFLNPDFGKDIHDPFLFKRMKKAVERIKRAIENKEKIVMYGDYDADGVCASIIIISTLKMLGAKEVEVYIPHRETEGYGLNKEAIKKFAERDVKLVITGDCGAANIEEADLAKELGIDLVITDHHQMKKDLPVAHAIVHPLAPGEDYPCKYLSGGGVAYKLACGLIKSLNLPDGFSARGGPAVGWEKWLLDLVAISTVADIVPLVGENRTLVKYGLVVLNKTKRIGLKKLIEAAGIGSRSLDTHSIGFQIAPRINAAGRMNHANQAFILLNSEDEREARRLAQELEEANKDRQKMTTLIFEEAKEQIGEAKDKYIVTAFKNDWPFGLAGLVAGKISEEYNKPCFIFTENQGEIVGSARCPDNINFDLIDALEKVKYLLTAFGGHKMACGCRLAGPATFEEFDKEINKFGEKKLKGVKLEKKLNIDLKINLSEINWELYGLLAKLEPFGEKNPAPRYLAEDLEIQDIQPVGKDGQHLRLMVSQNSSQVRKMIGFWCGELCEIIKIGDKIDAVFEVGVNEWNGSRELELKMIDIKHNTDDADLYADLPANA